MFDIEKYKEFLHKQITGKAIYLQENITNKLLESLYQFDQTPSVYLYYIPSKTVSTKLRQLFSKTLKPSSVSFNAWFLYEFGYKYCNKCKEVKATVDYNKNEKNSNKLADYCVTCNSIKYNEFRVTNPLYNKEYTLLNPDYHSNYYLNNTDKIREYNKNYKLRNPDKNAAKSAKYRAVKLQATPKWLTKQQYTQILYFYTKARNLEEETGVKYQVDHIIPLRGKNVCGLHVPWNLQIITAEENMKKNNKYGEQFVS